ncbi:uncharacterized protein LOC142102618 [Mixophyes fleayi]|uniref:uncharacterized protein LOC142102618 n=1 Tax=Mixophyes fleayi TaxID=3061075 RepID=UPI003F4E2755
MADIAYAEMSFTKKAEKPDNASCVAQSLQSEDITVTYAAVGKTTGKKKGKSTKKQEVSPQSEDMTVTYAAVRKTPGKKNGKSSKKQKVSPQSEDKTSTYSAVKKFQKPTEKETKSSITQESTDGVNAGRMEKNLLSAGRRSIVFLVPTVIAVILLISTIYLGATCSSRNRVNTQSNGHISSNGSETSFSPGLYHACPAHWILIDNKCYFFSENKKSHHDSERNCRESGSRLATVKDGVILRLVTITAQEFWIGLTSTGGHYQGKAWTGRWVDGSIETITEGTGTCAKIGRNLTLENCYTALHWICERDTL